MFSLEAVSEHVMMESIQSGIVDALRHNNAIDDRKMLVSLPLAVIIFETLTTRIQKLEHVLVFLSRLPEGPFQVKLQNAVVELCMLCARFDPQSHAHI